MELKSLNKEYINLPPQERIEKFYFDFGHQDILCTSSFGITSGCLLTLIALVNKSQKIHFIDTGNHFLETLIYKNQLSRILNLKVESISADSEIHRLAMRHELWKSNPEFCCQIKKVKPLSLLKKQFSFWITGLQNWQTDHRSSMQIFEENEGLIKFNPIIDLSREKCFSIMNNNSIPNHPLLKLGYHSVSCVQCTKIGNNRDGRWPENSKTECGLHR